MDTITRSEIITEYLSITGFFTWVTRWVSQELHTLSERAYTKCYFPEVGKVNVVHNFIVMDNLVYHGRQPIEDSLAWSYIPWVNVQSNVLMYVTSL
jgi:hypothetical protein